MQVGLSRASGEPNKIVLIGGFAALNPPYVSEFLEVPLNDSPSRCASERGGAAGGFAPPPLARFPLWPKGQNNPTPPRQNPRDTLAPRARLHKKPRQRD